jgi:L-lactate utilization protein LutC
MQEHHRPRMMEKEEIDSSSVERPQTSPAREPLPASQRVEQTLAALRANGFRVDIAANRDEALDRVRSLLPEGARVMTGSSTTLDQIGFTALLKSGAHPWVNLKEKVVAEQDAEKRLDLARQATLADYFLGSVQAVTMNGQLVAGSGSGSQIAAYSFMAKNLIFVVGTHKITSDLEEALKRVREHCVPLEDGRMKSIGAPGTVLSKILIYEKEPHPHAMLSAWVILVNEPLGF